MLVAQKVFCWLNRFMFNPETPHVFALPPGTDFPAELVNGLIARLIDQPPHAISRVTIYLNTARMLRRVRELFTAHGARFLPRLLLLSDLAKDPSLTLPDAIPPLRRRLQMAGLIAKLLDAQPDLAPRSALYDLADRPPMPSLALMSQPIPDTGKEPKPFCASWPRCSATPPTLNPANASPCSNSRSAGTAIRQKIRC
jgi:hypothetical protein